MQRAVSSRGHALEHHVDVGVNGIDVAAIGKGAVGIALGAHFGKTMREKGHHILFLQRLQPGAEVRDLLVIGHSQEQKRRASGDIRIHDRGGT